MTENSPTRRWFRLSLRTLLIPISWIFFASSLLSQEPPEPIDTEGQVTLRLTIDKYTWPAGKIPSVELFVINDTDRDVRVPRSYFGTLIVDGQGYRFRWIPFLGDGGDEVAHPARSENKHGGARLDNHWIRRSKSDPEGEWIPLDLKPGEHVVKYRLNGMTSNEIRFTIENAE